MDRSNSGARRHWAGAVFLIALAVRLVYLAVIYRGAESLFTPDSGIYLALSQLATPGLGHGPWMPDPGRMPIYPLFLGLHQLLLGTDKPIFAVLTQLLIDSAACVLIGRLAEQFDQRLGLVAGVLAAVNPTQIVLAAFVLTDSLFLFFVCLMLLGCAYWLDAPRWRYALLIGIASALALLTRAVIWPWLVVLPCVLVALRTWKHGMTGLRVSQAACIGAIAAIAAAPIMINNARTYGVWQISSQNGEQALLWIAPLVREAKDGTSWETNVAALERRLAERYPDFARLDPFALSAARMSLAREELSELGFAAIAKAWAIGAAINLFSPAVILSPPLAQLPRTGFYATPGASKFEKIWNFLWHSDNPLYGRFVIAGTAGATAIIALAVLGTAASLRKREEWPLLLLLALWVVFILVISGPVASAKYRLPFEPVLMVLNSAALVALADTWRRRSPYAS